MRKNKLLAGSLCALTLLSVSSNLALAETTVTETRPSSSAVEESKTSTETSTSSTSTTTTASSTQSSSSSSISQESSSESTLPSSQTEEVKTETSETSTSASQSSITTEASSTTEASDEAALAATASAKMDVTKAQLGENVNISVQIPANNAAKRYYLYVVDSKGRPMQRERTPYFTNLKSTTNYLIGYYPNGTYTAIFYAKTSSSAKVKAITGKVAFKVSNGKFAGKVSVPATVAKLSEPNHNLNQGVNPIHMSINKYGTLSYKIDWMPQYFTSTSYNFYRSNGYVQEKSNNISFITLYDIFPSSFYRSYPNDTYTLVMNATASPLNGNQKFEGTISFEVKNGRYVKTVTTPSRFLKNPKSVETIKRSVKSGSKPSLPSTVKVTWTNGATSQEKVTWTAGNYTNTSNKAKTVNLTGTVANTKLKAKATVTVHGIKSVSNVTASTTLKKQPSLPGTVKVTWTDNASTYEKVSWKLPSAATFKSVGQKVKVSGTVAKTNLKPTATVSVVKQLPTNVMYRLYNPNSGEHFYTKNAGEKNNLAHIGWKYEGVAWYAPTSGSPVYRLYNPNSGDHHYTLSKSENDGLVRLGWKAEGVAWYSGGSKPLYRLYNPNAKKAGSHHYTLNKGESDGLKRIGWKYEGIGWYAVK